jgi:molybdopterin-containing oxidoreductase family membrane subunit
MAKMLLVTGSIVSYAYAVKAYCAWVGGDVFERHMLLEVRPRGPLAPLFWTVISCNCGAPLLLWSRRIRRNVAALFVLSLVVQLGMWLERLMLIVSSLSADFLPSARGGYKPTLTDGALLCGTLCFFLFLFLVFLRLVPFIPVSEVEALNHELRDRP